MLCGMLLQKINKNKNKQCKHSNKKEKYLYIGHISNIKTVTDKNEKTSSKP